MAEHEVQKGSKCHILLLLITVSMKGGSVPPTPLISGSACVAWLLGHPLEGWRMVFFFEMLFLVAHYLQADVM